VSNTGGLADTVENYDETSGKGTGIVINTVSAENIYNAVKKAVDLYTNDKKAIRSMREQGMTKRFSWKQAAERYTASYNMAIEIRRG
jgi:starch synthase